jgi:50S ribosomal subunit-associated GTPase HflX
VQARRQRQRQRRAAGGCRSVALVGYTNAGKSSLMTALTGKVQRWLL